MINLSQVKNAYGKNIGDIILHTDFSSEYACDICFYGSIWTGYIPIDSAPHLLKNAIDFDDACFQYERIYFNENPKEKELEGFVYKINKAIFLYRLKRGARNPYFTGPSRYCLFDIILEYKIFHASFINGEIPIRKELKC